MSKKINDKKHWYDGKFYQRFIAHHQDKIFNVISDIIDEGSTILDAGCGTGRFALTKANKFKHVTGIDLSSKNIEYANQLLEDSNISNISFIHTDAGSLGSLPLDKYDYAIITYVIHEVPEAERIPLIKKLSEKSKKIIFADYNAPQPMSLTGVMNWFVELAAGIDHFRGYRSYLKRGGLKYLADQAGLKISKKHKLNNGATIIIETEKE